MAEEGGARRCNYRALCRRRGAGASAQGGRRPIPGAGAGTAGEIKIGTSPDKTRLIEFGRYATERRARRGEGKPETFNFLGFTHICGTSHKTGYVTVRRKTIGKRMAAK